jgi:hypothetical protein
MSVADDPRQWPEARWNALALKVAALLDGLTADQADRVLRVVGGMVAASCVFHIDNSNFQELVRQTVCGRETE